MKICEKKCPYHRALSGLDDWPREYAYDNVSQRNRSRPLSDDAARAELACVCVEVCDDELEPGECPHRWVEYLGAQYGALGRPHHGGYGCLICGTYVAGEIRPEPPGMAYVEPEKRLW